MVNRSDSRTRAGRWILSPLVAMGIILSGPAVAGFNPYVVPGLAVSAEAEDGVAAKEAALGQALEESLARVLRRIATAADRARLPAPTPARAETLLEHIAIDSEQVAPQRYRAVVTVVFSRLAVRGLLARHGASVVDEPAPAVLLIPMLEIGGEEHWWEAAEPWAEALAAIDFEDGLTPVRFPSNSAGDRGERTDRLLAGDRVSLDTFRVRYRTQGALVVRAEKAAGEQEVRLSLIGEDAAGRFEREVEVEDGGLDAAARRVADVLSERWKRAIGGLPLATETGAGRALSVRVLLSRGEGEWRDIRRRLEQSGRLSGVSVESMAENGAAVLIWHSGSPDELARALSRQGLDLFEGGGAWMLQSY